MSPDAWGSLLPALLALLLAGASAWLICGGSALKIPRRARPRLRLWTKQGMRQRPGDTTGQPASQTLGHTTGAPEPVPLVLEMCATLLESGLPIRSVLRIIGTNVPGYESLLLISRALDLHVGWDRAWSQGTTRARELEQALRLTRLSGAPAAGLLRSSAVAARKREIRRAEARGAEFGIKLVIPLGLCALPAFIALGVVPVVISLLPQF